MDTAPAKSIVSIVDPARQRLLAHLAMLLFAALIAGSFTGGALAVPHLAAAPLNALRFLLAALLMGAFAFGAARHRFALPKAPWRFGIMGFLMAIYFVTMFVALAMTLPVATSAVYTLVPLMTALTAHFLVGQRSGPLVLLSLVLAGLGAVWVIFRGDPGALLAFDIGQGELIYFVGCLAYAFYAPLLRRFSRGEASLVLSFWTLAATAIWITGYGLPEILTVDWLALPPVVWWVVLYLAVGPTAICFFLIQFASHHLPAAKVIAYGYLTPAFVILFEGFAGHGWASVSVLAGALVTVLGLVVLARVRDR
jgi:drug/metabolite transporter (DMT)-like permease